MEAPMFSDANAFLADYTWESASTAKVLGALTDASLAREKAPDHNTLGDIAWHVATAPLYMLSQVGFNFDPTQVQKPEKLTAAAITAMHEKISAEVKAQTAGKTPAELAKVYHVFGMMDWPCGQMLTVLLNHEIHHRGQISVLMRQAGLVVPSIYGPTKEMTVDDMKQQMEQRA
jgi:uncharacterized damage-inducible protein DinB